MGWARYCPICRSHVRRFRQFGQPPRADAQCPVCGSLERHRLLWVFLRSRTDLFDGAPKRILHVAPEPVVANRLQRLPRVDYLSADLEAPAMVRMDITDIAYPDGSFDVIFCSHVLEHVEDDRLAMRELRRVLAPAGWAILLVPISPDPTFEDPTVRDPEERVRLFGQHDHVRKYGPDFEDRLRATGWRVRRVAATDLLQADERVRTGIAADESVFHCTHPG